MNCDYGFYELYILCLETSNSAVVGDEGRAVRLERVAEHLGHARLDVVGRAVEVLADGRHHPARKIPEYKTNRFCYALYLRFNTFISVLQFIFPSVKIASA